MITPSEDKSCHTPRQPETAALQTLLVTATVLRQDDDGVWLSTPLSTSCSGCNQQDSCSSGLVAKALPVRQQQLFLAGAATLLPGQQVEISVSPGAILGSALLVYLLPLAVFIATLLLGQLLQWHELAALAGAILATAAVFRSVQRIERGRAGQLQIQLVRVLPDLAVTQVSATGRSA
jgi:sigma-E factor negative regulatory protein RseC